MPKGAGGGEDGPLSVSTEEAEPTADDAGANYSSSNAQASAKKVKLSYLREVHR